MGHNSPLVKLTLILRIPKSNSYSDQSDPCFNFAYMFDLGSHLTVVGGFSQPRLMDSSNFLRDHVVLGLEPRTSEKQGKCSTTELHSCSE